MYEIQVKLVYVKSFKYNKKLLIIHKNKLDLDDFFLKSNEKI